MDKEVYMNEDTKNKNEDWKPFKDLTYEKKLERLKGSGYCFVEALYESSSSKLNTLQDVIKKYSWKLFNYIFTGKKDFFVEYLERICASHQMNCGFNIDEILSAVTREEFREYALAFMCGFLSENKKGEGGGNEKK